MHGRPDRVLRPVHRAPPAGAAEDNPQGEIAEGTGEIGFFSPHSWWPLFVGFSCAVAAAGFAMGWWLFLIGALMTMFTVIGFVFEYYRGHYAHCPGDDPPEPPAALRARGGTSPTHRPLTGHEARFAGPV